MPSCCRKGAPEPWSARYIYLMSENNREDAMTMRVNGWTFDPSAQQWTAKVGPARWLLVDGDLDNPPSFTPVQAM